MQPPNDNTSGSYPPNSNGSVGDFSYRPLGDNASASQPSYASQQPSYDLYKPFDAPGYGDNPYDAGTYASGEYPAPASPAPQGYAQPTPGIPATAGHPAPFGYDPQTGLPYSDKSKVAAGLLQLFFGYLGIGRFYIGDNSTGGIQLALGMIGLVTVWFIIGIIPLMVVSIWALVDAIQMLTGSVRDAQGRPLR